VFSHGGPEASLEAVAQARPASGSEHWYRHFPTREALYEALYRREVEQLAELAKHLVETEIAPVEAPAQLAAGRSSNSLRQRRALAAALAMAAHGFL